MPGRERVSRAVRATAPDRQGRGYASAIMRRLAAAIGDWSLGALSPSDASFYARLGWERWRGPLSIRTADGPLATPDEEVMILRLPATPPLDLDAPLSAEWRAGERVGAVLLARQSSRVAKLRLLILEPAARGLGLGKRLVAACVRFAKRCGYRRLVLWTQSELAAARAIYVKAGFRLVRREKHRSFGKRLTGEYWELDLRR